MNIKINRVTGRYQHKFKITDFEIPCVNIKLNGKNGAGKTLLLKWLWKHPECFAPKQKIVYINQHPKLFFDESIAFNLSLLVKNNLVSEVWNNFNDFYPVIDIDEKCINLSGGQYQLLYLLIMFTQTADVYLIDEPFSNLDANVMKSVEQLISKLNGINIIVSHDQRFADYLQLVLDKGTLWKE